MKKIIIILIAIIAVASIGLNVFWSGAGIWEKIKQDIFTQGANTGIQMIIDKVQTEGEVIITTPTGNITLVKKVNINQSIIE